MIFVDNKGRFYSEEDVSAMSSWEIDLMGIHAYEETEEKRLFEVMDEMIT